MDKSDITNIVATGRLNCHIDLQKLARNTTDIEYNPFKFIAAVMKIRRPGSTCLVFPNGRLVLTGTKRLGDVRISMRRFARKIEKAGFEVKLTDVSVKNIVASFRVGRVNLRSVYETCRQKKIQAFYEQEIFPGLRIHHRGKLRSTWFLSGTIIVTGSDKFEEIQNICNELFVNILLDVKE